MPKDKFKIVYECKICFVRVYSKTQLCYEHRVEAYHFLMYLQMKEEGLIKLEGGEIKGIIL